MIIRRITDDDVVAVSNIGNRNYSKNYYESDENFRDKILHQDSYCLLAEIDNESVGYAISFPDICGVPYPINSKFEPVKNPNCQYIHDLCVDKYFRNINIGNLLLKTILDNVKFDCCTLTAIQGSENFWIRHGFVKKYTFNYCDQPAQYMQCNLKRHI